LALYLDTRSEHGVPSRQEVALMNETTDGRMTTKICITCKFYEPDTPAATEGACKRYAPRPATAEICDYWADREFVAYWPTVLHDWHCFEWEETVESRGHSEHQNTDL
jgi:hypothetical protein